MRTLTDATLFTVNGPRGCYYAIRNHVTGAVLTERTDSAAAALANENDLVIAEQREISHAELLEMLSARSAGDSAAAEITAQSVDNAPGTNHHGSGLLHRAKRMLNRDAHASTTPS